jgi:hypothetical protein
MTVVKWRGGLLSGRKGNCEQAKTSGVVFQKA